MPLELELQVNTTEVKPTLRHYMQYAKSYMYTRPLCVRSLLTIWMGGRLRVPTSHVLR
jgi:hypothetical protein